MVVVGGEKNRNIWWPKKLSRFAGVNEAKAEWERAGEILSAAKDLYRVNFSKWGRGADDRIQSEPLCGRQQRGI